MAAVAKISPYRKRQEGVALFIDWENLKISLQTILDSEPDVQALLEMVDNYGQRGVSRAYADWQNYPHLHDDQTRLLMRSVETVQILGRNPDTRSPIKNSADVALAVEATRTCYHHPDLTTFVLVTGDGDLVHLVNELKRNRNRVVIVGVGGAVSRLLRESADEVLIYEQDVEPHLSKMGKQSDVVDIDTVLEGIKSTLAENRGSLRLADLGRMMGRKGISLRSSNYSLGELSDILVKRGEIERVEQGDSPYLRLRHYRQDSRDTRDNRGRRNSSRGNGRYDNARGDNGRNDNIRNDNTRNDSARNDSNRRNDTHDSRKEDTPRAERVAKSETDKTSQVSVDSAKAQKTIEQTTVAQPAPSPPANAWQQLSAGQQQEILRSIHELEQRSPFITFNYMLEHLHQQLPAYNKDRLEHISRALSQEGILQQQRQGSGREGRTLFNLNYDHPQVDMKALQADAGHMDTGHMDAEQPNAEPKEAEHGGEPQSVVASGEESIAEAPLPADNPHILRQLPSDSDALWQVLQQAEQDKTVLEVVPELDDTGQLRVLLADDGHDALYARLPTAQLELTRVDDASAYAHKPIDVQVLSLDAESGEVVLSRRGVVARRMVEQAALEREVSLGREVTAKVTSLNEYAAFIDLGGAQGFVHRSEIAEPEPKKPSDVLSVGDIVVAKATLLDWEKERLQFSIKQAQATVAPTETPDEATSDEVTQDEITQDEAMLANRLVQQWTDETAPKSSLELTPTERADDADTVVAAPENTGKQLATSQHQADDSAARPLTLLEVEEVAVEEVAVGEVAIGEVAIEEAETVSVEEGATHDREARANLSEPLAALTQEEEVESKPQAKTLSSRPKAPKADWSELKERYPRGRVVTGEVNNVVEYGAFITLEDGYSALLHKSELQALSVTPEENDVQELVAVGNHVDVVIKAHNDARQHLILGLAEREKVQLPDPPQALPQVQDADALLAAAGGKVADVLLWETEQEAEVAPEQKKELAEVTPSNARHARGKGMKLLNSLKNDVQNDAPVTAAMPEDVQAVASADLPLLDIPTSAESATPEGTAEAVATSQATQLGEAEVETTEPTSQAEDEGTGEDMLARGIDIQQQIIQHTTDLISHQPSTYLPLTQIYHSLEQQGVNVNPTSFKNALVRAHQGRKLRIVRHPDNRSLYAGLGVHTDDDISDILL